MEKATSALAQRRLAEDQLEDEQPERLLALARKKRERGEDVVEVEHASPEAADEGGAEVIDLMALLKERLGGAKRAAAKRVGNRADSGKSKQTPRAKRRRRPASARRG